MRRTARRTVVVASSFVVLLIPALGSSGCTSRTSDFPSHRTWVSDVTEVTRTTGTHLADRLPDSSEKTAIVLDIDNTALESAYATVAGAVPATAPVLAIAKQAKRDGAAVFFVSARDESFRVSTQANLESVGYPVDGLFLRPSGTTDSLQTYKTRQRIRIEQSGYTIVANIGNNTTDLAGGHAEHTTKLPDYDGLLP
jgi:predicted secreted acid phosphatase